MTTFPLEAPLKFGDKTWLNYEESIWTSLKRFQDGLSDIYANIKTLLNTRDGNKRLLEIGERMTLQLSNPTDKQS